MLGIVPRTVGDHIHFRVPAWRALLERFGVVDGTPENVRALMDAGEWIVLFPGGAREVFKGRGEKYALLWGERTGFARLAVECGYPIVPFSLVGAEDAYDVLLDAEDILASPVGPLVRRIAPRRDLIPPIVRGLGLTALPRVERFYFHFGAPVETRHLAGRAGDPATCFALRERVRTAVEAGITRLLLERERDPDRALLARLLAPRTARRRARPSILAKRTDVAEAPVLLRVVDAVADDEPGPDREAEELRGPAAFPDEEGTSLDRSGTSGAEACQHGLESEAGVCDVLDHEDVSASHDPAYFGGYLTDNYLAAVRALGLRREDVHRLAANAFEASFLAEEEKRARLRELDAYALAR